MANAITVGGYKEVYMKQCKKCGEWLELEQFYPRQDSKDGYRYKCKKCENEENKKWRKENRNLKTVEIDKDWLIRRRKELGLSRSKVSILTGISIHTYTNIEKVFERTSKDNWDKIEKVLGE